MLTHITSVCPKMTNYTSFLPETHPSAHQEICMPLVLSLQMVIPRHTLACSEKMGLVTYFFQYIILSVYLN